jgi:hypothetical protein
MDPFLVFRFVALATEELHVSRLFFADAAIMSVV